MAKLEDFNPGVRIRGLIPGETISVVEATWHGSTAMTLVYRRQDGTPGTQLLYRGDSE